MAVRPIVLYPDPVLLRPTRTVERFDSELRALVGDMTETLYAAPGVGLAANQIGVDLRVCVIDLSAGETKGQLHVLVNPTVTETAGRQVGEEGCLSFPDITLDIERPEKAAVEAFDLDGRRFALRGEGLMARCIVHECEHLDGQVFLRNVSALRRELVKKQIRKLMRAGDWVSRSEV